MRNDLIPVRAARARRAPVPADARLRPGSEPATTSQRELVLASLLRCPELGRADP